MEMIAEFARNYYAHIKFIHVIFAFAWGFAVPFSYSVYLKPLVKARKTDPDNQELRRREHWVWIQMDKLITVEHIAWPILIITGPLLYLATGWEYTHLWLMLKLLIIVIIFVPLEIHDIWFSHIYTAKAHHHMEEDFAAFEESRVKQLAYFKSVSLTCRISIPAIYYLAIVKPL